MNSSYINYLRLINNNLIRVGIHLPIKLSDSMTITELESALSILEPFCYFNDVLVMCDSSYPVIFNEKCKAKLYTDVLKEEVFAEYKDSFDSALLLLYQDRPNPLEKKSKVEELNSYLSRFGKSLNIHDFAVEVDSVEPIQTPKFQYNGLFSIDRKVTINSYDSADEDEDFDYSEDSVELEEEEKTEPIEQLDSSDEDEFDYDDDVEVPELEPILSQVVLDELNVTPSDEDDDFDYSDDDDYEDEYEDQEGIVVSEPSSTDVLQSVTEGVVQQESIIDDDDDFDYSDDDYEDEDYEDEDVADEPYVEPEVKEEVVITSEFEDEEFDYSDDTSDEDEDEVVEPQVQVTEAVVTSEEEEEDFDYDEDSYDDTSDDDDEEFDYGDDSLEDEDEYEEGTNKSDASYSDEDFDYNLDSIPEKEEYVDVFASSSTQVVTQKPNAKESYEVTADAIVNLVSGGSKVFKDATSKLKNSFTNKK